MTSDSNSNSNSRMNENSSFKKKEGDGEEVSSLAGLFRALVARYTRSTGLLRLFRPTAAEILNTPQNVSSHIHRLLQLGNANNGGTETNVIANVKKGSSGRLWYFRLLFDYIKSFGVVKVFLPSLIVNGITGVATFETQALVLDRMMGVKDALERRNHRHLLLNEKEFNDTHNNVKSHHNTRLYHPRSSESVADGDRNDKKSVEDSELENEKLKDLIYYRTAVLTSGMVGGMLHGLITTPLDVVRAKMSMETISSQNTMPFYKGIVHYGKRDGYSSLKIGWMPTVVKDSLAYGLFFSVFSYLDDNGHPAWLSGAAAGAAYQLIHTPFDILKFNYITYLMFTEESPKPPLSMRKFTRTIVQEDGFSFFFSSLPQSVLKSAVAGGLVFFIFTNESGD